MWPKSSTVVVLVVRSLTIQKEGLEFPIAQLCIQVTVAAGGAIWTDNPFRLLYVYHSHGLFSQLLVHLSDKSCRIFLRYVEVNLDSD